MSPVLHAGSRVEVAARDDRDAWTDDEADVRLADDSMVVAYFDEDGLVLFDGVPSEEGGWEFAARSRPWRAFLRPMADDPTVLEGEIEAPDERFAWRLVLADAGDRAH